MSPSESLTQIIPDSLPSSPPPLENGNGAIEPNGHGNGNLDGSFDQHALLHAL